MGVDITLENTTRKRPEEQFSRLSSVIDAMIDGVTITDLHGRITYVNNALTEQLGYAKKEMLGKTPATFIVKKDVPKFVAAVKNVRSSKPLPTSAEYLAKHKDGTEILFSVNFSVLYDHEGRSKEIIAVSRDISERKRVDTALRASEERYRNLVELAPDGIITLNLKGVITSCNPAFLRLTGFSKDEVVGIHFTKLGTIQARDIPNYLKLFSSFVRGKKITPYEYMYRRKDGTLRWGAAHASLLKVRGKKTEVLMVLREITMRKQMEISLREQEEKYHTLFDTVRDAIYITTRDGRFIDFNPAVEELFDYSEEELRELDVHELYVHPSDRTRFQQEIERTGTVRDYEVKLRKKDGTEMVCLLTSTVRQTKDGSILAYQGIIRDITEQKRADEALQRREKYFRALIENATDIISILDGEGIIRYQSPSIERVVGYKPEELIGKRTFDFTHPEDQPRMISTFTNILQTPGVTSPIVARLRHKNGSWRTLEGIANNLLNDPFVAGIVLNIRDITEQKQAEKALRESEAKYSALVENAQDGVVIVQDEVIKFANQAVVEISGYRPNELVGRPFLELVVPESRDLIIQRYKAHMAGAKVPPIYEVQIRCKDDSTIKDVEISAGIIQYQGRLAIMSIVRDITARRDLEERRDSFIEVTSHELRTPLTAIRGYAELLEQRYDELDQADREQYFETIKRNVQRLERLIKGVSTLRQIERGIFCLDMTELDIFYFLAEALLPYQTRLGEQLEMQSGPEKGPVLIEGDPDRLLQILDNLMENAVKHTPKDRRKILVTPEVRPDVVRILISDNGAGIAQEYLDRIFEPFTTFPTPYSVSGTGIGLYLSRMIAETHGGTLTAHSEGRGRGATFILEIPRKIVG